MADKSSKKTTASSTLSTELEGSTVRPKVFISYSWVSKQHREEVRQFADRLIANGVQVLLDEYDLQPGQDLYKYMENTVTNSEVTHVLIIADRHYTERANERKGGVGSETLLLSPEVYEKVDQTKIVPLVFEKDEDGKPFLPAYIKSRMHIDFTDQNRYEQAFEELLRHLFGVTKHSKPPLGEPPDFSTPEPPKVPKKSEPEAAIQNILTRLEPLRILPSGEGHLDEKVFIAFKKTKPLRDELLVALNDVIRRNSDNDETTVEFLTDVLQRLQELRYPPAGVMQWRDADYEHLALLISEIATYITALLIKNKRYGTLNRLVRKTYFWRSNTGELKAGTWNSFYHYIGVLDQNRNNRLQTNRVSIAADLIKERCDFDGVTFDELRDADNTLYLLMRFLFPDDRYKWWFPRLSVYRDFGDIRPFGEMISKERAEKIIAMFGYKKLEDFQTAYAKAVETTNQQQYNIDSFHYNVPSFSEFIPKDIGKLP